VRRKVQLVCGWFSSRKLSRRMVVGVATNCHGYELDYNLRRRRPSIVYRHGTALSLSSRSTLIGYLTASMYLLKYVPPHWNPFI
jgi:hypothetical protein